MPFWPFRRRLKPPGGRLVPLASAAQASREYILLKAAVSVGSGEDNDFVIEHAATSRRHAIIRYRFGRYTISDLHSANGTFVNGRRITSTAWLQKGDEIRLGAARFILANPPHSSAQKGVLQKAPRAVSTRALVELALVAFVCGFGLAQWLAYLNYHQERELILGDAVPLPTPAKPAAMPSSSAGQPPARAAQPSATPLAGAPAAKAKPAASGAAALHRSGSAVAEIPRSPKVEEGAGENDFAGAIFLTSLVPGSGTLAGRLAPSFTLRDLDGRSLSLASLREAVVFLNVWATWCPVCRREMPALEKLRREFAGSANFRILAVSEDQDPAVVARFIERNGYTFRVLLDPDNRVEAMYEVKGLPSTIIINRRGMIVWNVTGGLDWSSPQLRRALKKLL